MLFLLRPTFRYSKRIHQLFFFRRKYLQDITKTEDAKQNPEKGMYIVPTMGALHSQKIRILWAATLKINSKHVSPDHPFLIVHDIQNGTWSWGIQ